MSLSATEKLMAEAGIIAAAGAVFALLNLFNPGDMALGARLAFWIGGFLAAWIVVRLIAQFGTASAKLTGLNPLWGYAITIPLSTAVISWSILWWRGGTQLAASDAFGQIWPSTILVGIGFFALFYVLYSRADFSGEAKDIDDPPAPESTPESTPVTDLHERLPAGFPAILALSVEDHYTRVHAATRSEMVLMPLGEAMSLVPAEIGKRVHRSWWVAESAVESHKREGRDIKLTLTNGLQVPVSRAHTRALREAGWLG